MTIAVVLLTLAGCASDGGGRSASTGGGGANSAAYVPLSDLDGGVPPPCGPADAGRGRANARDDARSPASRPDPRRPDPRDVEPCAPAARVGPQTRVEWAALAVERDRFENPRFGRKNQPGVLNTLRIVIVNEGHELARANRMGRCSRQDRGVAIAAISEEEMQTFLRGIEQRGFFRLARPTLGVQSLFDNENARGRITVERGGESVTLVSMRGQGLSPATKAIPSMYSEVKQAIILLRNQTPAMSVVGFSRNPLAR